MEKKEENYIRQLLLELEDSLFSLKWYDKEDNEIMLKNIIGFDSIFQIIPKRFHKLLEGKIYTQEELDKAERRGYRRGLSELKDVLSNALETGAITEDPEVEIKRVIIDIELLEEENGKQNAR